MGREGLAGVQWALSGRPGRQALRHGLASLLTDRARLGPCTLRRAKYKPGRKLTGYYDVALHRSDGARPGRRPIAVTWTTDADAEDHPTPALLEMQAEAGRRGLAAPFHQLIAAVPDWGMRIQVSPLDPHFPQLARVSDPGYVGTMLASLYAKAMMLPGRDRQHITRLPRSAIVRANGMCCVMIRRKRPTGAKRSSPSSTKARMVPRLSASPPG